MKMLLAGEWVDRDEMIPVYDPYNDCLIDHVPSATAADAERRDPHQQHGRLF